MPIVLRNKSIATKHAVRALTANIVESSEHKIHTLKIMVDHYFLIRKRLLGL